MSRRAAAVLGLLGWLGIGAWAALHGSWITAFCATVIVLCMVELLARGRAS